MTQEHLDSDRLLTLVGNVPDGAEAAHLSACAACRSELALLSAARRLGEGRVPPIHVERVAQLVSRRLAEPVVRPLGRRSVLWIAGLASAASVVLVLARPRPPVTSSDGPVIASAPPSVLHELDDLSASELEEVLQTLPTSTEAMPHGEVVPLGDLSAGDLEQVLRSMEE